MSYRPSRSVAIESTAGALTVIPQPPMQPFLVPQFPLSQLQWLDHMAKLFARRHQRCMCVTLMVDAHEQRWVRPQFTPQRCRTDGVSWSHDDQDYLDRGPTIVIGGSYQSGTATSLDEALSLVPAFHGMHLINVLGEVQLMYAFVRHGGDVDAFDMGGFFIDDVAYALDQCAPLLQLA